MGKTVKYQDHRFCVAPMMEWTDRYCRAFHRTLSRRARLYTEMVTTGAVLHGDRDRLLGFDPAEQPVALQLGGSDPAELAAAARVGQAAGYCEINLNVGCPSSRVQSGRFGACLMAQPSLVADCVAAMSAAVDIPVTVKCRIGIDDQDTEEDFRAFIDTVAAAGTRVFIVHARKAWLDGLSPEQNRTIPPLDYGRVYRLKSERPDLTIVLNGGIADLASASAHLAHLDGVMLGRAAYQNPFLLAGVDRALFADGGRMRDRSDVVAAMRPIVQRYLESGVRLHQITRHMLGLYQGEPGARTYRRHLSTHAVQPGAGVSVLEDAVAQVEVIRCRAMIAAA
ncbi:MAG: tRNA dihydrouridine(20/20a) synthase DusA [Pseudomonadota bacterium]